MVSYILNEVEEMQKKLTLKEYSTRELLDELISREAVKLRYKEETTLLDVTT